MSLRHVAHTLQQPLKEEFEWLQWQQIRVPSAIDKSAEWCISFILML